MEYYTTRTPLINDTGTHEVIEPLSTKDASFWHHVIVTYIGGFVVVLGITGSILSLSALRLEKKNNATTLLLRTMLLSDLFMVITYGVWIITAELNRRLFLQGAPPYCRSGKSGATFVAYLHYVALTLINFAGCADSWSTVLVSINRYVAICKPEMASKWCTTRNVRIQISAMLALLLMLNIPLFSTTYIKTYKFYENHDVSGESCFVYLLHTPDCVSEKIYEYGIQPLMQHVVPLTVLLPLNVKVIWSLRKARQYRQGLVGHVVSAGPAHAQELNKVMISIVWISAVVFTLHLPLYILKMLFIWIKLGFIPNIVDENTIALFQYSADVSGVLYVSNSCINLIVYFFLRKTFRKKVFKLCCSDSCQTQ